MTYARHSSTPFLHTGYLIAVDNDPLPLHKVAAQTVPEGPTP